MSTLQYHVDRAIALENAAAHREHVAIVRGRRFGQTMMVEQMMWGLVMRHFFGLGPQLDVLRDEAIARLHEEYPPS